MEIAAIIYWDCINKKIGNAAINCGGCSSKYYKCSDKM